MYTLYSTKQADHKTTGAIKNILSRLDIIAEPHTLKSNLKLFFNLNKQETEKITVSPIFYDLEIMRKLAEQKHPFTKSNDTLAVLSALVQGNTNQMVEYNRELMVYQARIKAMCEISFILSNVGDATARGITVFLYFPSSIEVYDDFPKGPETPTLVPDLSSRLYRVINRIHYPGIYTQNSHNVVNYEINKIKADIIHFLPKIVILPANRQFEYHIKYDIVPEDQPSTKGKLTLFVKPQKGTM